MKEKVRCKLKHTAFAATALAALAGMAGLNPPVRTDSDRSATALNVGLKRIGTLRQKDVREVGPSNFTIDGAPVDRDFADFDKYCDYLPQLGVAKIRIMTGWAKSEKTKGRIDTGWLEHIVDWCRAHGIEPLLELSYGNPIYEGGGGPGLADGIPNRPEGLAAWDRWVEHLARTFAGRVKEWAMWNEPDNKPKPGQEPHTPEQIAAFNVRSARILKRAMPDCRLHALSLAHNNPEFLEKCLIAFGDDVKLFDTFIYHGYVRNPDFSYENVERQKELVARYAPHARLRQGENGCASEYIDKLSLSRYPWSELSQAKWDLRRMLGDLGHDVESGLFCFVDINYAPPMHPYVFCNRKGYLRTNASNDVIRVKRVYYAVQNAVSIFNANVERVRGNPQALCRDRTVSLYEYRTRGGSPLLVFWEHGAKDSYASKPDQQKCPTESVETRGIPVEWAGRPFRDPVWVDLLTGWVYEIPAGMQLVHPCGVEFVEIPVYDSPCVLAERGAIDFVPVIDASPERVWTPLSVPFRCAGTVVPRHVGEIRDSNWTIGCETIERGYADFRQYAGYLAPLGIKTIRIQAGWARCEPEPGKFDFAWLDDVIDFARRQGLNVLLETSYGNPVYPGAGGWDLGAGFPAGKEGLEAWDRWVETLAKRYKGRVRDWAMWNEPDIRNPALPGHEATKTPEEIAAFNVRTAKIIRRVIPDARLAGLSLATIRDTFFEDCLKAMGEDVKMFDWFIYHGYTVAPESAYASVEKLKAVLRKYNPAAKMRQGENGCPSELATRFALPGVAWSEYSQAKWDMRRMLGDLGHDVESSVFTICDFNHAGREINRKGLLRATAAKKVIAVKRAYYAVQNVASIFDAELERIAEPAITNVDISVTFYEYRNAKGAPLYVFWSSGDPVLRKDAGRVRRIDVEYRRPGDSFETRPTVFTAKGGPLKDPVWVDLLTGRVYELPERCVCVSGGETVYVDVPVYDSPCILTERTAIGIGRRQEK